MNKYYIAPGVYVEETVNRIKPVDGLNTGSAGLTERAARSANSPACRPQSLLRRGGSSTTAAWSCSSAASFKGGVCDIHKAPPREYVHVVPGSVQAEAGHCL